MTKPINGHNCIEAATVGSSQCVPHMLLHSVKPAGSIHQFNIIILQKNLFCNILFFTRFFNYYFFIVFLPESLTTAQVLDV